MPWVSLSSDGSISIASAPDVTEDTEFSFSLTVTDANDSTDTVEVTITVTVGGGGDNTDGELTFPELKSLADLKKKLLPTFTDPSDGDILIDIDVPTGLKTFKIYFSMASTDFAPAVYFRDTIRPLLRLLFGLVLVLLFVVAVCRIFKK